MTEKARVWAFSLTEARGHFRAGNVIDLVSARAEENAIHDARHVAGDAAARLSRSRVMRVRAKVGREFAVAPCAHTIRIIRVFQRSGIRRSIRRMRLMTVSAMRLPLAEAGRAPKCLHNEGRFTEPAVLIEGSSGDIAIRLAQMHREERGALSRIIHLASLSTLMKC